MENHTTTSSIFEIIQQNNLQGMEQAMTILINEAMKLERSKHLQCEPFERSDSRLDYANGFKPKTVNTRLGALELKVPQTRSSNFYPNCLEKGLRSERALTISLAEMYVQGVSTRNVTKIVEQMCGFSVSSSQVSEAAKGIDEQISKWRERPLGHIEYLYVDARYEKVRYNDEVRDCAVLIALGIDKDGKRDILGFDVSLSEAEVHWRDFFKSLMQRGMTGLKMVTSDSHTGLKAARQAIMPSVSWQRCQFHLQQNAKDHISKKSLKKPIANDIRKIFNATDKVEADKYTQEIISKYEKNEPKFTKWLEENIHESLRVFSLELSDFNRKRLRTSNVLERLNQTIKKRTRVVKIFPNIESCSRLVGALLMEKSEEWLNSKPYISQA